MIRQTPNRRLRVVVLAGAAAGMLATAALAATSTAPNGSYGKYPARGGYGGYGGYAGATPSGYWDGGNPDDGSAPDDGTAEKDKKDKKDKKKGDKPTGERVRQEKKVDKERQPAR